MLEVEKCWINRSEVEAEQRKGLCAQFMERGFMTRCGGKRATPGLGSAGLHHLHACERSLPTLYRVVVRRVQDMKGNRFWVRNKVSHVYSLVVWTVPCCG